MNSPVQEYVDDVPEKKRKMREKKLSSKKKKKKSSRKGKEIASVELEDDWRNILDNCNVCIPLGIDVPL